MAGVVLGMQVVNGKLVRQGLENFTKAVPEIGRLRMYRFAQAVSKRYVYTQSDPVRSKRLGYRKGKLTAKPSPYVRTFVMLKSRKIVPNESGYTFVMDPVGPRGQRYASIVVGTLVPGTQHWVFKGRWAPLVVVVDEESSRLPEEVRKALGVALATETAKANK